MNVFYYLIQRNQFCNLTVICNVYCSMFSAKNIILPCCSTINKLYYKIQLLITTFFIKHFTRKNTNEVNICSINEVRPILYRLFCFSIFSGFPFGNEKDESLSMQCQSVYLLLHLNR